MMELLEPLYSPILVTDIFPSEKTVLDMKNVIKYEEEEYMSIDCNDGYIGDKECFDKLHNFPEFEWLNCEVNKMLMEFADVYRIQKDKCNFYVQKSWPVILKNDDIGLQQHTHPNSHISFVYYLQVEPNNDTGQLYFGRNLNWWDGTIPYEDSTMSLVPQTNKCIMFPSGLSHGVTPYVGNMNRIAITYDILIVSKSISGLVNREMMISDPIFWRKLNG